MFRRFTERWFGVKNKHQAAHFKQRLSLVYAFVAWNCFGVMLYSLLKKEMPNGNPSERRKALTKLTGAPQNMYVYQFEGLTLTNEFDVAYKAKIAQEEREAAQKDEPTI